MGAVGALVSVMSKFRGKWRRYQQSAYGKSKGDIMIEEALILAAEKGTRMWPLTENNLSFFVTLCGKSIIEQQIFSLKNIGVKKFTF